MCHTPGSLRCRAGNAGLQAGGGTYPSHFDELDSRMADEMFEYVDEQVEAKNFEGSQEVLIQVEGESFKRKYQVTWELGAKGEGKDVFSRTDVQF
jgi:hypothetical protein